MKELLFNLERNGLQGYALDNREELFPLLQKLIVPQSTVGCGDSLTLEQLNVFPFLRENYQFYDKDKSGLTNEEKRQIYLQNFSADVFITGTNAVTREGELFNIDGNGSRVAPMIYGPKRVIIIVGINKIVDTIAEAIERVRQHSAPLDAKRLNKNTPCVSLNRCINCHHKERICNDFVLITSQFDKNRIKVIFLPETLGF